MVPVGINPGVSRLGGKLVNHYTTDARHLTVFLCCHFQLNCTVVLDIYIIFVINISDGESVSSLKILTKKEAKRPAPQKLVRRPAGRNIDPRGGNQRTTKFGMGEGEGSGFQAAHVVLAANRIKVSDTF